MAGLSVICLLLIFYGMGIMIGVTYLLVNIGLVYALMMCIFSLIVYLYLYKKGIFERYQDGIKKTVMKIIQILLIIEMVCHVFLFIGCLCLKLLI